MTIATGWVLLVKLVYFILSTIFYANVDGVGLLSSICHATSPAVEQSINTTTHTHTDACLSDNCMTTALGCAYEFAIGRNAYSVPVLILDDSMDCGGLPTWAPYKIAAGIVLLIILLGLLILCLHAQDQFRCLGNNFINL